jgi:hypothetical protein
VPDGHARQETACLAAYRFGPSLTQDGGDCLADEGAVRGWISAQRLMGLLDP